jgi:hypothetical protein
MLFFVVMFLVLRVLLTILGVVGTLALLRFLILLAVFVQGFALLVLCHRGLHMIDTVLRANVTRKKNLENRDSLPPTGGRRELTKGADLAIKPKAYQREGLSPWLSCWSFGLWFRSSR